MGPRGGSCQFFCPRVGFRVFRFCSGRVLGQRNLVRVKLGSIFFCIFQSIMAVFGKKLAIFLKNNLLWVTWVLQNLLRVSSGS